MKCIGCKLVAPLVATLVLVACGGGGGGRGRIPYTALLQQFRWSQLIQQ